MNDLRIGPLRIEELRTLGKVFLHDFVRLRTTQDRNYALHLAQEVPDGDMNHVRVSDIPLTVLTASLSF
jgi:hypothetical protein